MRLFMDETPKYLLAKNHLDRAKVVVEKMARVNKTEI